MIVEAVVKLHTAPASSTAWPLLAGLTVSRPSSVFDTAVTMVAQ